MKTCPKCKTDKESLSFHKSRSRKDGLKCWCKDCCRKYQQSKAGKEASRRYNQTKAGKKTKQRADQKHYQTEAGKETSRKSDCKQRQLHPERIKARKAIYNAIRLGRLIRPDHCEMCFIVCRPEGHHEDYSKQLEVDWLCTECHNKQGVKV